MLLKAVNRIAGEVSTVLPSSPALTALGLNATGTGSSPGFRRERKKSRNR